jgi:hypothetical protein
MEPGDQQVLWLGGASSGGGEAVALFGTIVSNKSGTTWNVRRYLDTAKTTYENIEAVSLQGKTDGLPNGTWVMICKYADDSWGFITWLWST